MTVDRQGGHWVREPWNGSAPGRFYAANIQVDKRGAKKHVDAYAGDKDKPDFATRRPKTNV